MQKKKLKNLPQLSGAKYKYVCSQNIIDTDQKYIEELETRFEESADIWNLTSWQIYGPKGYIVEISALKNENRKLKAELHLIKKFLEEAKRKTNRDFSE